MPPVATPSKPRARAAKPAASDAQPSRARATSKAGTALTLSSKNYSSWSLRGWLMARFAGLAFDEVALVIAGSELGERDGLGRGEARASR